MGDAMEENQQQENREWCQRITEVSQAGYVTSLQYQPAATVNTYNKILMWAGHIFGWKDEKNGVLNVDLIEQSVAYANYCYTLGKKAFLTSDILKKYDLENQQTAGIEGLFSPVMVILLGMEGIEKNCPVDYPVELRKCEDYRNLCALALSELARFRCGHALIISEVIDYPTPEQLGDLIFAQSRLLYAQEALNHAYMSWYEARNATLERIAPSNEQELALQVSQLQLTMNVDKAKKSNQASNAAKNKNAKTNKAKEEIREIWRTGKYTTKLICADEECKALGISFDTARKALRNA